MLNRSTTTTERTGIEVAVQQSMMTKIGVQALKRDSLSTALKKGGGTKVAGVPRDE